MFCFQEMTEETRKLCRELFPLYSEYRVTKKGLDPRESFYQAIYVHPRFTVTNVTELLLDEPEAGLALALNVIDKEQSYTIVNLHGVSRAYIDGRALDVDEKMDFPVRIKQFEIVRDFAQATEGNVIIGGDFNVLPKTQSIRLFQEADYKDLIQEYQIQTTRNHYAWDLYPDSQRYYYSDYVFVSPGISVRSFEVSPVEVSDHLPLILEIDY
ncbi:MAG: endonuclease/exonuclease/phosphatase family protein [Candidatus Moranbacteria bacterium]|nr:endonuclease/exonuclease/phosphatase family protein [Candidatus Moranbacteria bacterium]